MIRNSIFWLFVASILFFGTHRAVGDLPIHATLNDVKGAWTVYLSAESEHPQLCGSTLPNKNPGNLAPELQVTEIVIFDVSQCSNPRSQNTFLCFQNYKEWMQKYAGGVRHSTTILLTDERTASLSSSLLRTFPDQSDDTPNHRSKWVTLAVRQKSPLLNGPLADDEAGENSEIVGSWTMVYDEGMEIYYGENLILTGFLKYSLSPEGKCRQHHPESSDQEDPNGKTQCYITDPNRTSIGWYTDYTGDKPTFGCWYGEKKKNKDSSTGDSASLYVSVDQKQSTSPSPVNLSPNTG